MLRHEKTNKHALHARIRIQIAETDLIELFELRVSEGGDRKRLQVEELRRRRTFLRQQQMPEGNRQQSLAPDPSVRHHADKVLKVGRGRKGRERERKSFFPLIMDH